MTVKKRKISGSTVLKYTTWTPDKEFESLNKMFKAQLGSNPLNSYQITLGELNTLGGSPKGPFQPTP